MGWRPKVEIKAVWVRVKRELFYRFTPQEIAKLNTSLSKIEIHRARLPEAVLQFSGVEAPVKSNRMATYDKMRNKSQQPGERWRVTAAFARTRQAAHEGDRRGTHYIHSPLGT